MVKAYIHPQLKIKVKEFKLKKNKIIVPAIFGKRYEVVEIFSRGGFGIILMSKDRRLHKKKVLIKIPYYPQNLFDIPNDKGLERIVKQRRKNYNFEREVLLEIANRDIDSIPFIMDFGTFPSPYLYGPHQSKDGDEHYCRFKDENNKFLYEEEPYLALSYISGETLGNLINNPAFAQYILRHAKKVIFQIGTLLELFHRPEKAKNGKKISLIYQDLKPDNIIYKSSKSYSLIDFGSFAIRSNNTTGGINVGVGTPGFRPPEFTDPNFHTNDLDERVDVFSLGATIYSMLAGQFPKEDKQGRAQFKWNLLKKHPSLWTDFIKKAVAYKLENRFQSIFELQESAKSLPQRIEDE